MFTTYRMNVNELTIEVLNSIKAAFKDKTIEITVSEAVDETEYILSTKANRESIEKSMQELKEGKGITFTLEEFQKKYDNEGNNI
jgi:hypothetical protein